MQPVVRAVDVGFGYTKYVRHVDGNVITCNHFPSVAEASIIDPAERSWGGPRDTIAVRVDKMFYEAGPDIDLALGNFRPQLPRTDDYLRSPEYLALMRIAMDYMQVDTIDLLVVGLPVGLYAAKKSALERLSICSNDPVCADHEPDNRSGDRATHGAACHSCLLISETSCERRNQYLDRSLLVHTMADDGAELFSL